MSCAQLQCEVFFSHRMDAACCNWLLVVLMRHWVSWNHKHYVTRTISVTEMLQVSWTFINFYTALLKVAYKRHSVN